MKTNTKDIMEQASSLPVEERASLIDSLLKTLNTPDKDIDQKWLEVAKKRHHEISSGNVKPIPGNKVYKKIQDRFSK